MTIAACSVAFITGHRSFDFFCGKPIQTFLVKTPKEAHQDSILLLKTANVRATPIYKAPVTSPLGADLLAPAQITEGPKLVECSIKEQRCCKKLVLLPW